MNTFKHAWQAITVRLEGVGQHLAPLFLRMILAWEFWEAGREKLDGDNWFGGIQDKFPVPFNVMPADLSWGMATWFELVGAVALLLGLATRFFAFSLIVLTIVATASVHWPAEWASLGELWRGYAITDRGHGNYKLPLLFFVMLVPLFLRGAGRFSIDALLARFLLPAADRQHRADVLAWGLASLALGLPLAMLFPLPGIAAGLVGAALVVAGRKLPLDRV